MHYLNLLRLVCGSMAHLVLHLVSSQKAGIGPCSGRNSSLIAQAIRGLFATVLQRKAITLNVDFATIERLR